MKLLALKMEEGVMSQGIKATSRRWKRQGNQFPPTASRNEGSLAFSSVRPGLDFQPTESLYCFKPLNLQYSTAAVKKYVNVLRSTRQLCGPGT